MIYGYGFSWLIYTIRKNAMLFSINQSINHQSINQSIDTIKIVSLNYNKQEISYHYY